MALNSTITIDVSALATAARDMGSVSGSAAKRVSLILASGTGANQADVVFADTRTITGATTDALDLKGGGLLDPLGVAFAPAKLKVILVVASAANPNPIQVVRPAANGVPGFVAAGDGIILLPGAAFCWVSPSAAGVAVTADTGDLLHIINTVSGNADYDIILIGTSA